MGFVRNRHSRTRGTRYQALAVLAGVRVQLGTFDTCALATGHLATQQLAGDERPDAVEDRIDEGPVLGHRKTDQHCTLEPSGDDRNAGKNPSQGRDAGAPGVASQR